MGNSVESEAKKMCSYMELFRPIAENGEEEIRNPDFVDFSSELDGHSTL